MTIEEFIPSPKLQSYIHRYYLMEGDFGKKTRDVFFADGCMEIVFNIDLDFYRDEEKENWAKVIGQITRPLNVKAAGKGKSFGIWFAPHGFSMFSNIPIQELNDRALPLDDIFNKDFINFVGDCLYENDIQNLITGTNKYFEKIMKHNYNPLKTEVIEFALHQLFTIQDKNNLDNLVKDCNISHRYLQKIFKERIGLSPMHFQTVLRFQRALNQMTLFPNETLTSITYQAGYYDQSHFIREFKRFTGFKPSTYTLGNHPINQNFLMI